jgi:predicted HicB family RNase H-like nuclease
MSHRGFTPSIKYDERDGSFVCRIPGIRGILTFHGRSVEELRAEFEKAIDDYLLECNDLGRKRDDNTISSCQ